MTTAPNARKNILMIVPDQWRYDQLGMDPALTPNFHALMRDGVAFENHYGQMVPCAPSRASEMRRRAISDWGLSPGNGME